MRSVVIRLMLFAYFNPSRWIRFAAMAYVISGASDSAAMGCGRGVRSRSRSPIHAAVCEESPPMPRAGVGLGSVVVGPRLCQAAGQQIMHYGTDCVSWLRIRKEGLRGDYIELCADEPCTPGVDVIIELNLQRMLFNGLEVFPSANGVALSGWVPTMYIERAVFVKMRGRQNRHNLFKDQIDLTNHQIRSRTAIGLAFVEALSARVPDACSRSLEVRRSCSRGSRGCGYDHCDRCESSSDCGSEAPTARPGSARLRPAPRHVNRASTNN